MRGPAGREHFPASVVVIANLVPILIYGIGIILLTRFSFIIALVYVAFILLLECRLIGGHCRDCFYYGKTCASGKGRLSALFFKKGDPEKFQQMTITWKDLLPDFLVFIIPVLAGLWLLVMKFSWTILFLTIALLILGFPGNALVRGQLACRYCRQREIGCPAEKLFDKTKRS